MLQAVARFFPFCNVQPNLGKEYQFMSSKFNLNVLIVFYLAGTLYLTSNHKTDFSFCVWIFIFKKYYFQLIKSSQKIFLFTVQMH